MKINLSRRLNEKTLAYCEKFSNKHDQIVCLVFLRITEFLRHTQLSKRLKSLRISASYFQPPFSMALKNLMLLPVSLTLTSLYVFATKKEKKSTYLIDQEKTLASHQNTRILFTVCPWKSYQGEGPIHLTEAQKLCLRLESQIPLEIEFSRSSISNTLEGGTSSAMSLKFLNMYLNIKKAYPQASSYLVLSKIQQLSSQFSKSSLQMRTIQAAYNAIQIHPTPALIDFSKAKIQAIANHYGIKILEASQEFDVSKIKNNPQFLKQHLDEFPSGCYMIQLTLTEDTFKTEESTRTYIYINQPDLKLVYNPERGLTILNPAEQGKILIENLADVSKNYVKASFRFYRINEKTETNLSI